MKVIFFTEKGIELTSQVVNTIDYALNKKDRDRINFEIYFYNKNFIDTFSEVEKIYLLIEELGRFKIGFERQDDDLKFRYINQDVFIPEKTKLRIEDNYIVLDLELLSTGKNRDWIEQRC